MVERLLIVLALTGCQSERASCSEVADHVLGLIAPIDDHARAVRNVFATRCRADDWSREVRRCIADTTPATSNHCRSLLTPAQLVALDRDLDAVTDLEIPRACADYKAVVERVARCPTLDADVRETLARNLAEHEKAWSKRDPREVAAECTTASQAVLGAAAGCFRN